jgi:hypothetical protein
VQELADGVVDQQHAPDLLLHPLGVLERSTSRGPRWWVFSASRAVSSSHRWASSAASSTAGAASGSRIVVTSR